MKPSKHDPSQAELLKFDGEWAEAARSRNLERIVSFWADDAVIYPPKQPPIVGKAAIRKFVGESLNIPGFSVAWKPSDAVVSGSGDLGYTIGTNTYRFPDAQGRPTTSQGRYVCVWKKGPGGRWRCVVDVWNEAPTPVNSEK